MPNETRSGWYHFCVPPCRPELRKSLLSRSSRKLRDAPMDRGPHSTVAMYRTAGKIRLPQFRTTRACPVPRPSGRASSTPGRSEKVADLRPRHAESRRPRRTEKAAELRPWENAQATMGATSAAGRTPRARLTEQGFLLAAPTSRTEEASFLLAAPAEQDRGKRCVCICRLVTKELTGEDEDKDVLF